MLCDLIGFCVCARQGFSFKKTTLNGNDNGCVKFTHEKLRQFDCEFIHSLTSSVLLACDKIRLDITSGRTLTMLFLLLPLPYNTTIIHQFEISFICHSIHFLHFTVSLFFASSVSSYTQLVLFALAAR